MQFSSPRPGRRRQYEAFSLSLPSFLSLFLLKERKKAEVMGVYARPSAEIVGRTSVPAGARQGCGRPRRRSGALRVPTSNTDPQLYIIGCHVGLLDDERGLDSATWLRSASAQSRRELTAGVCW